MKKRIDGLLRIWNWAVDGLEGRVESTWCLPWKTLFWRVSKILFTNVRPSIRLLTYIPVSQHVSAYWAVTLLVLTTYVPTYLCKIKNFFRKCILQIGTCLLVPKFALKWNLVMFKMCKIYFLIYQRLVYGPWNGTDETKLRNITHTLPLTHFLALSLFLILIPIHSHSFTHTFSQIYFEHFASVCLPLEYVSYLVCWYISVCFFFYLCLRCMFVTAHRYLCACVPTSVIIDLFTFCLQVFVRICIECTFLSVLVAFRYLSVPKSVSIFVYLLVCNVFLFIRLLFLSDFLFLFLW